MCIYVFVCMSFIHTSRELSLRPILALGTHAVKNPRLPCVWGSFTPASARFKLQYLQILTL